MFSFTRLSLGESSCFPRNCIFPKGAGNSNLTRRILKTKNLECIPLHTPFWETEAWCIGDFAEVTYIGGAEN